MAFDLGGLTTRVRRLSPTQISATHAQAVINDCYQTILRSRPGGGVWFPLMKTTTFATVPDNTTGTIALTLNSDAVVGTSTAFTQADVGRYLYVGQSQPLRVESVTDATHLTLAQTWGEQSVTGQRCQITTLRYVLPTDCDRIIRLVGPSWPVVRRAGVLVDTYDPTRRFRGEPLVFYEIEQFAAVSATAMSTDVFTGQASVTQGSNTVTVDISSFAVGTTGYRVAVAPSWNTSYQIVAGRTTQSFRVDFGVPAPAGGLIDYEVFVPGAAAGDSTLQTTIEVEMWPVDEGYKTMFLQYRRRVDDLVADEDTPIIAGEAVLWSSLAEMAMELYGRSGDQTWLAQSQQYQGMAKGVLDSMLREDRRMRGALPVVLDRDDYSPTWDQAWIANMRILSTLSQSSLA